MGSIYGRALAVICAPLLLTTGVIPQTKHTVLVATMGADTVAVDRYTRQGEKLEGVLLVTRPEPHTMHYKATLAPSGRFTHLELEWRDIKGETVRSASLSFGIDSIRSSLKASETRLFSAATRLDAIPLPPLPYAAHSYSLLEQVLIILHNTSTPGTSELEWIAIGETETKKRRAVMAAADSVEIDFEAGRVRAQIDSTGRVIQMTVGDPPTLVVVQRSETDIDIGKLMAQFAARDTAKAPSPRPMKQPRGH